MPFRFNPCRPCCTTQEIDLSCCDPNEIPNVICGSVISHTEFSDGGSGNCICAASERFLLTKIAGSGWYGTDLLESCCHGPITVLASCSGNPIVPNTWNFRVTYAGQTYNVKNITDSASCPDSNGSGLQVFSQWMDAVATHDPHDSKRCGLGATFRVAIHSESLSGAMCEDSPNQLYCRGSIPSGYCTITATGPCASCLDGKVVPIASDGTNGAGSISLSGCYPGGEFENLTVGFYAIQSTIDNSGYVSVTCNGRWQALYYIPIGDPGPTCCPFSWTLGPLEMKQLFGGGGCCTGASGTVTVEFTE